MVALRVVPPEPFSLAALDLRCERFELVALLALIRRGLLFKRAWVSVTVISSLCVDGTLLGLRGPRRVDILPRLLAVLDLEQLDLPPEFPAVAGAVLASLAVLRVWEGSRRLAAPVLRLFAGAEVWGGPARVFDALRPAVGFPCADARAPPERLPLACP